MGHACENDVYGKIFFRSSFVNANFGLTTTTDDRNLTDVVGLFYALSIWKVYK